LASSASPIIVKDGRVRHVLDDPAWHALCGPLARFSHGAGTARRVSPEHSFFSAIGPNASVEVAARDVAELFAVGERGVFVAADARLVTGLVEIGRGRAHQMVLHDLEPMERVVVAVRAAEPEMVVDTLGAADVGDMMALIDHAKPGPFLARTIELGTYVGIRVDGSLVAMAGERLRPHGHVEVSAVSVHERVRRRGMASLVVAEVATRAIARGLTPFLHVAQTNVTAVPVYERLGFRHRRMIDFVAFDRIG
jgi:ribosomal protein S18 acetylase RimI-like enzyme